MGRRGEEWMGEVEDTYKGKCRRGESDKCNQRGGIEEPSTYCSFFNLDSDHGWTLAMYMVAMVEVHPSCTSLAILLLLGPVGFLVSWGGEDGEDSHSSHTKAKTKLKES